MTRGTRSGRDHLAEDGDAPLAKPRPVSILRHWGGFVLGGVTAFAVDGSILMLLTRTLGVPTLAARLVAIATAMVVSWLINRTITFPTGARASLGEFTRFAAVAWTASAVNYVLFAGLVLGWPAMHPILAVALASLVAMCLSYAGMRFGVFARSPHA